MFLLKEIGYRVFRSLGRLWVLLAVAGMLVASMGAYLGNLQASRAALENLAESIPVTVRVLNRSGTQSTRLSVDQAHYDALTTQRVHGTLCTADAAAALSPEARAQETFTGGDTGIKAANDFAALPVIAEEQLAFLPGHDQTFLSGREPLCGVSELWAQQAGAALGDELVLPVYTANYSEFGVRYTPVGEHRLRIAAIYPYGEKNGQRTPDMTVPAAWLRQAAEEAGEPFCYSSLSVVLDDLLRLTAFKETLPGLGFVRVERGSGSAFFCDAISVEDELFIKTAEELRENLRIYRAFQLPFFGLVTIMVMLAVFLVLRSSRKDMAIASSLGEPRMRISFVHFSGAVLTQMAGGCLGLAGLVLWGGVTLRESLGVLLAYLLCASVGTILALVQLLRFDTLALLSKTA